MLPFNLKWSSIQIGFHGPLDLSIYHSLGVIHSKLNITTIYCKGTLIFIFKIRIMCQVSLLVAYHTFSFISVLTNFPLNGKAWRWVSFGLFI